MSAERLASLRSLARAPPLISGFECYKQSGFDRTETAIVFALALTAAMTSPEWRNFAARLLLFGHLFVAAVSHPLLDMLTDGGLGTALFWPFSLERLFFPATRVAVSPIGAGFFSADGVNVIQSDFRDETMRGRVAHVTNTMHRSFGGETRAGPR